MSKEKNVREIVVAYLKDNGYDGLYCPDSTCSCNPASIKICAVMPTCHPGVLVDGKIVEREKGPDGKCNCGYC